MDELIRKQDAIKAICEDGTWLESKGCVTITMATRKQRDANILENLPTVQPTQEIIHCKDCKRFKKPSAIVDADWGWCSGWHMPPTVMFVKVDGFCHRAEKRGEAE